MGCLGECWDVGPPPDSILNLPPPPAPAFLHPPLPDLLLNTTPCSSTQICESWPPLHRAPDSGDYVEMPRKDIETWSVTSIDDTWLLVLVASSIGVLLLGALLAMFLLKCREMSMFQTNECSLHARDHRPTKASEPTARECTSVSNLNGGKLVHPSDAVLYHGSPHVHDNRMVWAALTPHGTRHFVADNYPRDLCDYVEAEDHYETVDVPPPPPRRPSAFADYDYDDPMPLIESYQMEDMMLYEEGRHVADNTDMRCIAAQAAMRRGAHHIPRPRVSSPTRIEHPNLPPLNLYPHNGKTGTLKRGGVGYRHVDTAGTLPKYGC